MVAILSKPFEIRTKVYGFWIVCSELVHVPLHSIVLHFNQFVLVSQHNHLLFILNHISLHHLCSCILSQLWQLDYSAAIQELFNFLGIETKHSYASSSVPLSSVVHWHWKREYIFCPWLCFILRVTCYDNPGLQWFPTPTPKTTSAPQKAKFIVVLFWKF